MGFGFDPLARTDQSQAIMFHEKGRVGLYSAELEEEFLRLSQR
jgi:hypothetical protein